MPPLERFQLGIDASSTGMRPGCLGAALVPSSERSSVWLCSEVEEVEVEFFLLRSRRWLDGCVPISRPSFPALSSPSHLRQLTRPDPTQQLHPPRRRARGACHGAVAGQLGLFPFQLPPADAADKGRRASAAVGRAAGRHFKIGRVF